MHDNTMKPLIWSWLAKRKEKEEQEESNRRALNDKIQN